QRRGTRRLPAAFKRSPEERHADRYASIRALRYRPIDSARRRSKGGGRPAGEGGIRRQGRRPLRTDAQGGENPVRPWRRIERGLIALAFLRPEREGQGLQLVSHAVEHARVFAGFTLPEEPHARVPRAVGTI